MSDDCGENVSKSLSKLFQQLLDKASFRVQQAVSAARLAENFFARAMLCALSALSPWPLDSDLVEYDKNNPVCMINFHIIYF